MIKAVIFDMDGLLIDSEPFWRQSHQAVLADMGHQVTEDDVRAAAGKRTLDQVGIWQERFGFQDPTNEEVAQKIVDGVIRSIHESGVALPGVTRLINELHTHNVPMAVASSSTEQLIGVVLERLGFTQYMQAIHSAENEERGKPFPDVFLSTAKTLGVQAVDCVVFEDSLNGVKAAKAANMKCIAVPESPYDPVLFKDAKADTLVNSLDEVTWQIIQELF